MCIHIKVLLEKLPPPPAKPTAATAKVLPPPKDEPALEHPYEYVAVCDCLVRKGLDMASELAGQLKKGERVICIHACKIRYAYTVRI